MGFIIFADYWPLVVLPGINQMGTVTLNTCLTRQSIWQDEMTGVCPVLKAQFGFPFYLWQSLPYRFLSKMYSSVQFRHSVVSDSVNPWTAAHQGFPVHHQLLELAQIHVHQVSDAIQPSLRLPSASPSAFNHAQHQDLFQ